MTRTTTSTVSRRRPPAIEPTRKQVRIDPPAVHSTPQAAPQNSSSDLPLVVLRVPEIITAAVELLDKPAPQDLVRPKNEQFKIIAVASGLVLLAAALFSGGTKRPTTPAIPATSPESNPSSISPSEQPAPPWREPVVSLPPVGEVSPREEYPSYRTADRSATLGEEARRNAEIPSRPSVRFEGSIEKNTPDLRYERP